MHVIRSIIIPKLSYSHLTGSTVTSWLLINIPFQYEPLYAHTEQQEYIYHRINNIFI